jgi:sugar lactone lactonase YvrE
VDTPVGGVAVGADGFVYVTHFTQIAKYTRSGTLVAEWDVGYSGLTSLAADVDGSLYVSSREGVVRRYSGSGAVLAEWAGWLVPGFPSLESLDGVAVDGRGHFYTVHNSPGMVKKFTTTGTLRAQWAVPNVGSGMPVRLATSPDGSMVYVVDYENCRVQVFTSTGGYLGEWGTPGTGPGQFLNPVGITVDGLGNVFIADTNASRVQVFGDRATYTQTISWAGLKRRYR